MCDINWNVQQFGGWRRFHQWGSECVVSCVVPVGNVSSMLFQEGLSSNFRISWGVGQAAHARNNPHVKCTGIYCA
jgi:hypothetical protein